MMEMTGVEESVQVMRLILDLFDRAFDKSFVIAGKTLELAGKIKDKGKDVAKVSSAFLYKKYQEAKAKLAPGEQNVSRLLDVLSDRKITPLFMQLDRKSLESFRSYVAENNLTYAFLPDLNTEDEFIEIVYPATEPSRTLFDVYMDKNKETAKPYTFSQYTENAREEDINNVKREVGEEYEKMDAAFRSAEVMEEAIKTGRLVISKEQLIKEAADTYKVELTDNDGKACFLLVASDKVIIDGDTSEVIIQLDKEKMMLVQYPDRLDITIDKNSLLEDETSNKYFTKVPGSKGQKFIFIDKKDAEEIYDGKTIKTKLVPDEEYEICDRDGNVTSKMRGDELYKEHYDKVATPLEDIVKMNINYAEMKKAKARSEEEDKEADKSGKKEEDADTTKENTDVDMPEQKESEEKSEPADEKTETASKEHTEPDKKSAPDHTEDKSSSNMSSDNKSNNAFVEVLPSQVARNDSKSVKVHLQEGDLYVYQSSVIKSEGHVFVCLNENKQYVLFDEEGKMSEKVYSASEIMTQIIDYATENKTPEEYRKRHEEERSKTNGEHDRNKRNSPNR